MTKKIIKTEKALIAEGKKFATTLKGGDVVLLHGELGAGKTTFTKGIAQGLDIKDQITSPTFTLMNVYKNGRLVHIDTYRLKNAQELIDIGAEDYIGNPDSISVIEWPEKIKKLLTTKRFISVHLDHGENGRILQLP